MTDSNAIAWLYVQNLDTKIVTAEGPFGNTAGEKDLLRDRLRRLCSGYGADPIALHLLATGLFIFPTGGKVLKNQNGFSRDVFTVNWRGDMRISDHGPRV